MVREKPVSALDTVTAVPCCGLTEPKMEPVTLDWAITAPDTEHRPIATASAVRRPNDVVR